MVLDFISMALILVMLLFYRVLANGGPKFKSALETADAMLKAREQQ